MTVVSGGGGGAPSTPPTANLVTWLKGDDSATVMTGGGAAQFNGSSQYLSIASNANLQTGAASWFLFLRVAILADVTGTLVGKRQSTNDVDFTIVYDSSGKRFLVFIADGTSQQLVVNADALGIPVVGTWYNILVGYDSVANSLFIKTVSGENASTPGFIPDSCAAAFLIGAQQPTPTVFFNGKLDDVVFGKPANLAAVKTDIWDTLHNGGTYISLDDATVTAKFASWGVKGAWPLDDHLQPFNVATDISGNGYHLDGTSHAPTKVAPPSNHTLSDGDAVATWTEGSSNAFQFVQTTQVEKPTLQTNSVNSKDGVEFTGHNESLRLAQQITNSTQGDVIAEFLTPDEFVGDHVVWSTADEGSANNYLEGGFNKDGKLYVEANTAGVVHRVTGNTAMWPATRNVAVWSSDGVAWSMRLNASYELLTVTTGNNSGKWFGDITGPDNTVIGATQTSEVKLRHFAGTLTELLAYSTANALSDLQTIETYLEATPSTNGEWTPADGTPDESAFPVAWLDTAQTIYSDDGVTDAVNNDGVYQWSSRDDTGHQFEETVAGNRPTYKTGGVSDEPYVESVAATKRLIAADHADFTSSAGYTLLVAARFDSIDSASTQWLLNNRGPSTGPGFGFSLADGRMVWSVEDANVNRWGHEFAVNGDFAPHGIGVVGVRQKLTQFSQLNNGKILTAVTTALSGGALDSAVNSANNLAVMNEPVDKNAGLIGAVYEALLYATNLSDASVNAAQRYLARRHFTWKAQECRWNPIISPESGETESYAPAPIMDGSDIGIYIKGTNHIHYYKSTDHAYSFAIQNSGAAVIDVGSGGSFDETSAVDPYAVVDSANTTIRIYYKGVNAASATGIGYATAPTATPTVVTKQGEIKTAAQLKTDLGLAGTVEDCGIAAIINIGGTLYWYGTLLDTTHWRLWYGTSAAGTWNSFTGVAVLFSVSRTNRSIVAPAVFKSGSKYFMFFSAGTDDTGRVEPRRLYTAESTDGISWTYSGGLLNEGDSGDWNQIRTHGCQVLKTSGGNFDTLKTIRGRNLLFVSGGSSTKDETGLCWFVQR